jgi:hypothetical protein
MNRAKQFPKYFAMQKASGYCVYKNSILKSPDTLNMSINILKPVTNISLNILTRFNVSDNEYSTYIRGWNNGMYSSCRWSYAGFEVEMIESIASSIIIIPVIKLLSKSDELPPVSNTIQIHLTNRTIRPRRGQDLIPDAYIQSDPVVSAPTSPTYIVSRDQVPVPRSIRAPALPPHVKKLIITDAISHNESCSITSEPITLENAEVTSCGHVFTRDSICKWLSLESSKSLCPLCKQSCYI